MCLRIFKIIPVNKCFLYLLSLSTSKSISKSFSSESVWISVVTGAVVVVVVAIVVVVVVSGIVVSVEAFSGIIVSVTATSDVVVVVSLLAVVAVVFVVKSKLPKSNKAAAVVVVLRLVGLGVGASKSTGKAVVVDGFLLGFADGFGGFGVVVFRSLKTSSGFLKGVFNAALNRGFFSPNGN
jgi:hypothetical protein